MDRPWGDSSLVEEFKDGSVHSIRLATPAGTVPLLPTAYFYSWGMYEQAIRQYVAAGLDSVPVPWLPLPARGVYSTSVVRRSVDSVTVNFFAGPWVAYIDSEGRILGATGAETTVQVLVKRVASVDLAKLIEDFTERDRTGAGLGRMSPRETVRSEIGPAVLDVDYSRPAKRGRVIFGGLVPWNEVWRTGANLATHFNTDHAIQIGETLIPAGSYTLWTLPTPSSTELIINTEVNQWGTYYDPSMDLVRLPMSRRTLPIPVERFTISIDALETEGEGLLKLAWDRTEYSVRFAIR